MSKVLFIGHYKENTGWGLASRNYLKALLKTGLDIVARPILLNQSNYPIDEEIQKAEANAIQDCDVCIQHTQPHYYDFNGKFRKNIGILIQESIELKHSGWDSFIKRMDEIWVPNSQAMHFNSAEFPSVKFVTIPHAFDTEKYKRKFPQLDIKQCNGNYKFYTIGEHNRRKRLGLLIEAYNLAFTKNDPVSLIIKANSPGSPPKALNDVIRSQAENIKDGLKLYPRIEDYPREIIITDSLSSDEIMGLHQSCDCFVLPSFGEAWSIPAFEAAVVGNAVIYNKFLGPTEYLEEHKKAYPIYGELTNPIGVKDTFENIHTGREKWSSISVKQLAFSMQQVFQKNMKMKVCLDVNKYSYESIGKIMLENLC